MTQLKYPEYFNKIIIFNSYTEWDKKTKELDLRLEYRNTGLTVVGYNINGLSKAWWEFSPDYHGWIDYNE